MSLFGQMDVATDVEKEVDTLGGGGLIESGLFDGIIKVAYAGAAESGAQNVTLHVASPDGKTTIRETIYVSSNSTKGRKTYYERDGKKYPLPGFSLINGICLLAAGEDLVAVGTKAEKKVIKVYDFESKRELPTEVDMLMPLLDKPITLGVLRKVEDKNEKNAAGKYVPSGEVREMNSIDRVFRASDGLTVAEVTAQAEKAEFKEKWAEKWTGVTHDKAKRKRDASLGAPGAIAGTPAGAAATPTKSLFAQN